jgi:hypothetical protein
LGISVSYGENKVFSIRNQIQKQQGQPHFEKPQPLPPPQQQPPLQREPSNLAANLASLKISVQVFNQQQQSMGVRTEVAQPQRPAPPQYQQPDFTQPPPTKHNQGQHWGQAPLPSHQVSMF